MIKINNHVNIPGGEAGKNLPASAGDTGSIPDPGRFHMPRSNYVPGPQLLSLSLETLLHNKRSHHNEKPARHS